MRKNIPEMYDELALQPILEKIVKEHYDVLEILCLRAKKQAEKVNSLERQQTASQYYLLCNSIIDETSQYIEMRKEKYIPYILELAGKVVDHHDCSNCSGGCKINHEIHLLELRTTNDIMQKMLNKLQMASLPLYSETLYPDESRLLRNHMALIESNLTELFLLESNYLFPKILLAQKSINAGN